MKPEVVPRLRPLEKSASELSYAEKEARLQRAARDHLSGEIGWPEYRVICETLGPFANLISSLKKRGLW